MKYSLAISIIKVKGINELINEKEKIKILAHLKPVSKTPFSDELTNDTLACVRAVKTIQEKNGESDATVISSVNATARVM